MFLPVKADFNLQRFPWLTTLVCAACLVIFLKQVDDWQKFESAVYAFCGKSRSDIAEMRFNEISDDSPEPCIKVMYGISTSDDAQATIDQMVTRMRPLKSFSVEDSKFYVSDMLHEEFRNFNIRVPAHPDKGLAYYTATWNPLTMVASVRSGPQTVDSLAAKLRWNPLFITMLPDSTLEVLGWVSPRAELCTLCPRGRVPETLTARWARGVQRRRPGERLSFSPGRG